MRKSVIRYGLIAGAIILSLSVGQWLVLGTSVPYTTAELIGYISIFVALSVIFFGIRHYRDHTNQGNLKFAEGFKIGTLIALFPAVVTFISTAVFFIMQGEEFMEYAMNHYRATLSAEEFEKMNADIQQMSDFYTNPYFQGLVMFLTVFLIGVVISLLSSLILKRSTAA